MARPTKRTPDREKRLLEALRAGNTRKAACQYAGIGVQTLDDWQRRFRDFRDAIEKAESEAEVLIPPKGWMNMRNGVNNTAMSSRIRRTERASLETGRRGIMNG